MKRILKTKWQHVGWLGFDSWWGLGIFICDTVSRLALGSTQPPIKWIQEAFSLGVKQSGHVA